MAVLNIKCKASAGSLVFYSKATGDALLTIATTGVSIPTLEDVAIDHTNSDTFTIDDDSALGKIAVTVVAGAADKTLTLTNTALTDNRTITFPNATGTVALTTSLNLTAGEDGSAGTLTIYPTTATNGTLVVSATNNGAARNVTITNAAHGQSSTYKIADCGAAAGQIPVVTSDHFCKLVCAADSTVTLPAAVTFGGTVNVVGTLATAANLAFTGAFAATIAVPSASTWTLPTGGGTLATTDGASTGTTAEIFTVDTDSSNAKIALDTNAATGNFTIKIVPPAALGAGRTITLPDASDTMVGKATTDILTNKTLTAPVINGITTAAAANNFVLNTGTGTFTTPTGTFTHYGNIANNGNITFDFSNSNGTFKTSTGATTIGGDTTIAAGKDLIFAGGAGYLEMNGGASGGIKLLPLETGTALTTISNSNCAAATITLPAATATLATTGLAETLNTKTLTNAGDITQTGATTITSGTTGIIIPEANTAGLSIHAAANKGSIRIKAVDNTGDTILDITNALQGQATILTIPDVGQATGNVVLLKAAQTTAGELKRADFTEEALAICKGIPINSIMAADGAPLGITETAGDHYLYLDAEAIQLRGEVANSETEVSISYFQFVLPENYVAAGDVTIRIPCKVDGAGTDNGSSVDLSVYEQASGAVGGDICATAAENFAAKSTWYNKDFSVTAAGLIAGDILNVKLTSTVIENAANALAFYADPPKILLDVKG